MAKSTGLIGYGTGPAGKTRINVMGPTPAPREVNITRSEPNKMFYRGKIARGHFGKRGR